MRFASRTLGLRLPALARRPLLGEASSVERARGSLVRLPRHLLIAVLPCMAGVLLMKPNGRFMETSSALMHSSIHAFTQPDPAPIPLS
jgi:hypothetical protein